LPSFVSPAAKTSVTVISGWLPEADKKGRSILSSVPVRISSCHQDGMLGGVYGRVISDVFALRGPSNQLNRSVESRMKWITIAIPNRNVKSATKARRGSNRSQIRHMIASLYVRYERATLATCWMLSSAVVL
jgi:hypothetical protein